MNYLLLGVDGYSTDAALARAPTDSSRLRPLETRWGLSSLLTHVLDAPIDALNLPKRRRVDPRHGPLVVLSPALLALLVVVQGIILSLLSLLPQAKELELCMLPLVSQIGVELLDSLLPLADFALEPLQISLEFRLQVVLHPLPPLLLLVLEVPLVRESEFGAEPLSEFKARPLREEACIAGEIGRGLETAAVRI